MRAILGEVLKLRRKEDDVPKKRNRGRYNQRRKKNGVGGSKAKSQGRASNFSDCNKSNNLRGKVIESQDAE